MINVFLKSLSGLAVTVRYTAALLILMNIRSFPLVWHIRVLAPFFRLCIQYASLCLSLLFTSRDRANKVKQAWFDKLSPVGQNPFALQGTYRDWVGLDDSDYNLHLSNSCYPETMDAVRFRAALTVCPSLFRYGGWVALGGTHHHFIREVPIFASYEVRTSIAAWDQKWIFTVSRFVTKGEDKPSRRTAKSNDTVTVPAIHTPSTPLETPSTFGTATPAMDGGDSNTDVDASAARLARAQATQPEPDGATLHCVVVSLMCFKHGRITIPPAIVLACDGLWAPAAAGPRSYSHANPPPSWTEHVQPLRAKGRGEFVRFIRGGWRDVPEGERWWEEALGGEVERIRAERLGSIGGLVSGIAAAGVSQPLPA